MKIKNYTNHVVHIVDENDRVIKTFERSGKPVRIGTPKISELIIDETPLSFVTFDVPDNLPEYENAVILIVSKMVQTALLDRFDLVVPTDIVKDINGYVIGCRSLRGLWT